MSLSYHIKKYIRRNLRIFLKVRQNENINDALERKYFHLVKKIDRGRIGEDEFREIIVGLGIERGDTLIVHCAWRGCYNLKISPIKVIEILEEILGEEGNLLMPAYGNDRTYLDLKNSESAAGVLSECFRKQENVVRSRQGHFSMCAKGKVARNLCEGHEMCLYSFDKTSPYYKAVSECNAKILLMGMNWRHVKTPLYHVAAVNSMNLNPGYKKIYGTEEIANIVDGNGGAKRIRYFVRNQDYINDDKVFRMILAKSHPKKIKRFGLKMLAVDGRTLYRHALYYCKNGGNIYKKVISVI